MSQKKLKKDKAIGESGICGCFVERKIKNINKFSQISVENDDIVPADVILEMLYRGQESHQALLRCRLNPNLIGDGYRDDLEYYIPQLINHILQNKDNTLLQFIMEASQVDFYFAHTFFFAWRSEVTQNKPEIENYLKIFLQTQSRIYANILLIAAYFEDYQFKNGIQQQVSKGMTPKNNNGQNPNQLVEYGTQFYENFILGDQLVLNNYQSVFKIVEQSGFCSTIDFWDDLIHISENLHLADPKLISLKADIQKINRNLPAAIYVPFYNSRNYVILNIVTDQCKVFSTKCRSPFYICLEVYRPEEEIETIPNPFKLDRISLPRTVGKTEKVSIERLSTTETTQDYTRLRPTIMCKIVEEDNEEELIKQNSKILETNDVTNSYYEDINAVVDQFQQPVSPTKIDRKLLPKLLYQDDQSDLIKSKSPFKTFRTWKLVHLIVKSGDDLKQEQFAMQMIQLFAQIFKSESLKLYLTTYEVISLGPGYGLIEAVQDAISVDAFKQKLQQTLKFKCLSQYFKLMASQAMISNFLSSLVAYSLVCYFMQIKDRHNGNILLHREGYLIHIDFGFFLSSSPKGNLEQDVPFKLLTEYIDILGGVDSNLFQRFRRMFFEGFKAIRKNKGKIMLLVKTMSNSGLKCFKQNSLQKLNDRFLQDNLSDSDLYVKCQELIDKSLDNWRAKWYDKYQYYFQNIFY